MEWADILGEDDMFLGTESSEQWLKAGTADAEDKFVGFEELGSSSKSHICKFFILIQFPCSSKEESVMIIPFEKEVFRHFGFILAVFFHIYLQTHKFDWWLGNCDQFLDGLL